MDEDKYFRAGFNVIQDDDLGSLGKLIIILHVKELPKLEAVTKISPWIDYCFEQKKDKMFSFLLTNLNIIIELFVNRNISIPILRWTKDLFKLNEIEILSCVPNDDLETYARIEFTFYHCPLIKGDLPQMTLEIMRNWEKNLKTSKAGLNTYLVKRLNELVEYAPIPIWIIPHDNPFIKEIELLEFDHSEQDFTFPSELDEQADYVLKNFIMTPDERKMAKETLLHDWANLDDPENQSTMIMDIFKTSFRPQTKEEIETFRIWGPINPIPDEYDDVESCHMFGHYPTWFTGICETCELGISEYYHAVRAPVEGGGWAGCFCSLKCANDEEVDINEEDLQRIGKELFEFQIYHRVKDDH